MARYQVWLAEPDSTRIKQLQPASFSLVHVVGDVGVFSLVLPYHDAMAIVEAPDRRIEFMRRPIGGLPRREFYGFVQTWEPTTTQDGKPALELRGTDAVGILRRRQVVDSAGDLYLTLTAKEVDDAMKQAVRDNITAPTDADRDITILSVDPDLTDGVQITRDFANISLLSLLQDLQAYSKAQGDEVFWGLRPSGSNFEFFTSTGQYGRNRTYNGDSPLVFGDKWRNVTNIRKLADYEKIASVVYAVGSGIDENRAIREVEDATRTALSIYGRREVATYATNSDANTALDDAANDALAYARPVKRLLMDLLDTPRTPYGTNSGWGLGDKVVTDIYGSRQDAIVRAVNISVDGASRETIRGSVEIIE